MQRIPVLAVFLIFSVYASAQLKVGLYVDGVRKQHVQLEDTVQLIRWVRTYTEQMVSEGYFFSGIDSVVAADTIGLFMHRGNKFDAELVGERSRKPARTMKNQLKQLANRGYPFASVHLDSTRVHGDMLLGRVRQNAGPYIELDSAVFLSPINTNHAFVYQLVEHEPGNAFSEKRYSRLEQMVGRADFLSLRRPVDISFQDEKAKLYLDLEEHASSTFQGIVGLQQQGSEGSVFVGGFDLRMQNLFRSGKQLDLSWQRFDQESQELSVYYRHPFLLGSVISPFFGFELLRQDSLFLRRSSVVGAGTYLSSLIELQVSYHQSNGSLLSTDEISLLSADVADYLTRSYELRLQKGGDYETDLLRTKLHWKIGLGIGRKEIERNVSLPDTFYDTLELETNMLRVDLDVRVNQPIMKRQVLFQQVRFGLLQNSELLNNERYRIGGLNSLRGFDENFFFLDRFLLSRTELRSFFEQGSYLFAFYDQLFFAGDLIPGNPAGTGFGFSLATLSGRFNFAVALGRSAQTSLDINNMKAHFGYLATF